MRELDTEALALIASSLGIGRPSTATEQVVFDDDNLQQVLDVSRLVARAGAPTGLLQTTEGGGGIFAWGLSTTHLIAGDETDTDNPFDSEPGVTTLQRYPSTDEITRLFDLYLAGPIVVTATDSANVDYFRFEVVSPAEIDGGVLASSGYSIPLVQGTLFDAAPGTTARGLHGGTGDIISWIPPRRLEPKASLRLTSDASAACSVRAIVQLLITRRGTLPHFAL